MGFKLLYAGFETCFGWDPGTKGAGILYAQDKCPIMNQHPLRWKGRWFMIGHLSWAYG